MFFKKYKYILILLFMIFAMSGTLTYYWIVGSQPPKKPVEPINQEPKSADIFKIGDNTKIIFFNQFKVCKKYNLNCEPIMMNDDTQKKQLQGLTINEVENIFSQDNWLIEEDIEENQVNLIQLVEGLCPSHKKIWHLGPNNTGDYIAVYYGPSKVNKEGGVYKVTEIPLKKLSPAIQEKIYSFEYEFYQEEELVAILDSFSEFLD